MPTYNTKCKKKDAPETKGNKQITNKYQCLQQVLNPDGQKALRASKIAKTK